MAAAIAAALRLILAPLRPDLLLPLLEEERSPPLLPSLPRRIRLEAGEDDEGAPSAAPPEAVESLSEKY